MTARSSKEIRKDLKHLYRILYYGKEQADLLELKDMIDELTAIISEIKQKGK